jgi:hypothetical protein
MNPSFEDWVDTNYRRVVREEKGSCFAKTYYVIYVPRSRNIKPFHEEKEKHRVPRIVVVGISVTLLMAWGVLVAL